MKLRLKYYFYYLFAYINQTFFRLRDYMFFLHKEPLNYINLLTILSRHVDLNRNLSKYPAAANQQWFPSFPLFSHKREFAILVGDTAKKLTKDCFNFAELAGFSRKICIATFRGCQRCFPSLRSNFRMPFGCPILNSDSQLCHWNFEETLSILYIDTCKEFLLCQSLVELLTIINFHKI